MSVVKINRELLTDVVDALVTLHAATCNCHTREMPCPVGQRIARVNGVLVRAPATE